MYPGDREPPPPSPEPHARTAPAFSLPNPLAKQVWDRFDIMTMLVLLQASSGRSGEDAVERAADTLHALEGFFVKARKP